MKLKSKTSVIKNIANILTKTSSRDGIGSSLNGMYIETDTEKTSFKTQQIDFGVMFTVNTENTESGSVCVPANVFDGVVNPLVDEVVDVVLDDKKLKINTNTSNSEVYTVEGGEAPTIQKPDGNPLFKMRREVLIHGLRGVQHAAARSEIKPEIASVYIYSKDNSIYFVSTDAFRLAETRFLLEEDIKNSDDINVLIPIKNIMKIIQIMEGVSDTTVEVYIQEGVVYLKTENTLVRTVSVKGSFPDYKNIMPKEFDANMTVLKGDIVGFLKKAKLFANKLNKLSLTIEGENKISLEFGNDLVGFTKNTIPATVEGGGKIESLPSFNYKFVNDALSVVSDDRVTISAINDKTKPVMVRGVDDTAFTAIMSPLLEKDE